MSERASVFDNLADFDVGGFTPKPPKAEEKKIPTEAVRAISVAANFPSREAPAPVAAPKPVVEPETRREQRRYRTGRNVQLNIKVDSGTLDTFYKIADAQGWVLGETLEQAVKALQEKLSASTMKESGG